MQTTAVGEVTVVHLPQRLDQWTAPEAESLFNRLIESGARRIVFDLSSTEYISSAGIRLLITAAAYVERQGLRLVLCCANPVVRELFNVTGVRSRFEFYETRACALAHFSATPSTPLIE